MRCTLDFSFPFFCFSRSFHTVRSRARPLNHLFVTHIVIIIAPHLPFIPARRALRFFVVDGVDGVDGIAAIVVTVIIVDDEHDLHPRMVDISHIPAEITWAVVDCTKQKKRKKLKHCTFVYSPLLSLSFSFFLSYCHVACDPRVEYGKNVFSVRNCNALIFLVDAFSIQRCYSVAIRMELRRALSGKSNTPNTKTIAQCSCLRALFFVLAKIPSKVRL